MANVKRCKCGAVLSSYNLGKLCSACQQKGIDAIADGWFDDLHYAANNLADILGLTNAESVKRLARKNLLPRRVPGIRKWLWFKSDIHEWIENSGEIGEESQPEATLDLTDSEP